MQIRNMFVVLVISSILSACATQPQQAIQLNPQSINTQNEKIGVAMTALPKIDTTFPGANCLLCLFAASVANSKLTTHSHTLAYEDLGQLKDKIAEAINKKGGNAMVIPEDIDLKNLADNPTKGQGSAKKDFSAFAKKYGINKILIIDISSIGFIRTYADYFPTGDPKAFIKSEGYLVSLQDNKYEWFMPVDINKAADLVWDEPPQFPGLTNAYFQVVEQGKETYIRPFAN